MTYDRVPRGDILYRFNAEPDPVLLFRGDGRIEQLCSHGVGHVVYVPKRRDESWWEHGCDGCCKEWTHEPSVS